MDFNLKGNMKTANNVNIKNKRATFDYEILETFVAGTVLSGTEIKSIRLGQAGRAGTFCYINNGEVWVKNMYVAEYSFGSYNNHQIRRDRKLLLTKKEIAKMQKMSQQSGYTIVPLKLFINEKGLAKMSVGIARGKKEYDKRQSIREREDKRAMDRAMKK